MHRIKRLSTWRRHKKPYEGQSKAKGGVCLSDHWHRSGLEIKTCDELRLRVIAKDIMSYEREVPIILMDGEVNVSKYLGKYYADFVVLHNDGHQEIIEAKGIFFPTFKKKWKVLEKMSQGTTTELTIVTK